MKKPTLKEIQSMSSEELKEKYGIDLDSSEDIDIDVDFEGMTFEEILKGATPIEDVYNEIFHSKTDTKRKDP